MEINEKLERQFIKVLQKPSHLRTKTDEAIFDRRCKQIQKQDTWNDDFLEKYNYLNEYLIDLERDAFYTILKIEDFIEQMESKDANFRANIEVKMDCYNHSYYPFFDPEMEGNPFIEIEHASFYSMIRNINKSREYVLEDWTELCDPFLKSPMCYSMHQLVFHTYLPHYDLFKIQNIYFSVYVTGSIGELIK